MANPDRKFVPGQEGTDKVLPNADKLANEHLKGRLKKLEAKKSNATYMEGVKKNITKRNEQKKAWDKKLEQMSTQEIVDSRKSVKELRAKLGLKETAEVESHLASFDNFGKVTEKVAENEVEENFFKAGDIEGAKNEETSVRSQAKEDFSDLRKEPARKKAERNLSENNDDTKDRRMAYKIARTVKDNLLDKYSDDVNVQSQVLDGFVAHDKLYKAEEELIFAYKKIDKFSGIPDAELLSRKIGLFEFRFGDGKAVREAYKKYQDLLDNKTEMQKREYFEEEMAQAKNSESDMRRKERRDESKMMRRAS